MLVAVWHKTRGGKLILSFTSKLARACGSTRSEVMQMLMLDPVMNQGLNTAVLLVTLSLKANSRWVKTFFLQCKMG